MINPLPAFEIYTGLTVKQAARLLGLTSPTYYQYRRTGKMPDIVIEFIKVLTLVPRPLLENLIMENVHGDDL